MRGEKLLKLNAIKEELNKVIDYHMELKNKLNASLMIDEQIIEEETIKYISEVLLQIETEIQTIISSINDSIK